MNKPFTVLAICVALATCANADPKNMTVSRKLCEGTVDVVDKYNILVTDGNAVSQRIYIEEPTRNWNVQIEAEGNIYQYFQDKTSYQKTINAGGFYYWTPSQGYFPDLSCTVKSPSCNVGTALYLPAGEYYSTVYAPSCPFGCDETVSRWHVFHRDGCSGETRASDASAGDVAHLNHAAAMVSLTLMLLHNFM